MTLALPMPGSPISALERTESNALWHSVMIDRRVGANVSDAHATFDAFVRERLPHLLRFGRVLTGNDEAAADLVQDALERTIMHWERVESRDDPEGYVRRVMVNRNISIWRRLRRERITDTIPDDGYVDRPRDSELWEALLTLPPRQRAVIALRYYEDKTEAEVAQILGCSVGTVKSQASKAITKLRALVPTFADVSERRRGDDA